MSFQSSLTHTVSVILRIARRISHCLTNA
jgi:hypothetical protein